MLFYLFIVDSDQVNLKCSLVIPIFCIEANSYSATQEIKEHLEVLKTNASNVGFDIIGYAFDGDRQYLDLRFRRYSQWIFAWVYSCISR